MIVKGGNSRTWEVLEPGFTAGPIEILKVRKIEKTQGETVYIGRMTCCGDFYIVTHKSVMQRIYQNVLCCANCAKTKKWKQLRRTKVKYDGSGTAIWPALAEQYGKQWHGRI